MSWRGWDDGAAGDLQDPRAAPRTLDHRTNHDTAAVAPEPIEHCVAGRGAGPAQRKRIPAVRALLALHEAAQRWSALAEEDSARARPVRQVLFAGGTGPAPVAAALLARPAGQAVMIRPAGLLPGTAPAAAGTRSTTATTSGPGLTGAVL